MSLAPLIGSFLIILREGFEAMLIAMLVFTYISKFDAKDKVVYAWYGILIGIILSVGIALGFTYVAGLTHEHEELFEGVTMLAAAGMLTYVAYWCHGAQRHFDTNIKQALTTGTAMALGATVCLAILREGFEIVLFYAALFSSDIAETQEIILGGILGVMALGGLYIIMKTATDKIPTKHIFQWSKYFLVVLAVYFAYEGGHELLEVLEHSND